MSKTKAEKLNSLISEKKSGWLDKANWREENEAWLDISFAIAVKILSALRENKKADVFPKTQKELAQAMDCSPQYVNKVLKGAENLQLETISKIGRIMNIQLIEVPRSEKVNEVSVITNTAYFQDLYSTVENRRRTLAGKPSSGTAQFSKTTKVEQKGLSYSSLKNQYTLEGDFDNDPSSPLKIVA